MSEPESTDVDKSTQDSGKETRKLSISDINSDTSVSIINVFFFVLFFIRHKYYIFSNWFKPDVQSKDLAYKHDEHYDKQHIKNKKQKKELLINSTNHPKQVHKQITIGTGNFDFTSYFWIL